MIEHNISANNESITNAGITDDYKQAIAEFIWNGFDARASVVNIDYKANKLGSLIDLSISDNGIGINYDSIGVTFGTFLDSQKKRSFQRTSTVKGKKGKGRFSFCAISGRAIWKTTYLTSKLYKSYKISIDRDNKAIYNTSELTDSEYSHSGTTVVFQNIDRLTENDLISATFTEYLASQFAWFLALNKNKNYKICLNGIELDYAYLISKEVKTTLKIDNFNFEISYIRWAKKIGDRYYFYLLNSSLEENCKILSSFNNNSIEFYHSVYVASSYFDTFIYDPNATQRFDGLVNQSDKVYKSLIKQLRAFLSKQEKEFVKDVDSQKLIQRYEKKGIFPDFKNNDYDKAREMI